MYYHPGLIHINHIAGQNKGAVMAVIGVEELLAPVKIDRPIRPLVSTLLSQLVGIENKRFRMEHTILTGQGLPGPFCESCARLSGCRWRTWADNAHS